MGRPGPCHNARVLRVGLTGGTGAGKSTAAARLAVRGAVVLDADRLAREVVEPGTDGLAEVVATFGAAVLTPDGALDRAALGRRVFGDDDARARLNALLHPRIAALTAERMAAADPGAIVVHDVPLLVENRMGPAYHLVVVVHADAAERVRRLVAARGLTEQDAAARIAAQADDAARRAAADVWLDNSGDARALVEQVDRLWDGRLVPYAENLRLHRPASGDPSGPDAAGGAGSGPGAAARVRARVLHALGPEAAEGDVRAVPSAEGRAVELVVQVRDPERLPQVPARLDAAGIVAPSTPGADGWLLRGADPGLPVVVHLRRPVP